MRWSALCVLPCLLGLAGSCVFDASTTAQPTSTDASTTDASTALATDAIPADANPIAFDAGVEADAACIPQLPPTVAGAEAELAPAFAANYQVYDLGTGGVPGVLGGVTLKVGDDNTLLVIGRSSSMNAGIYEVALERGPCGHILGFNNGSTRIASTTRASTSIVAMPNQVLLYSEYPSSNLGQLLPGATSQARRTSLAIDGVGGVALVPGVDALRVVAWPSGGWYQLNVSLGSGGLYDIDTLTNTKITLPNGPSGIAYVPQGSPGFPQRSVMVVEWAPSNSEHRITSYEVNAQANPMVVSRQEFLAKTPTPVGGYFDSVSGDYLFAGWTANAWHIYLIRGFVAP